MIKSKGKITRAMQRTRNQQVSHARLIAGSSSCAPLMPSVRRWVIRGKSMSESIESTNLEPDESNSLGRERLDNEINRLELERYKVERELKLENRRYALEKYKTKHERQFLGKNLGF
jgi:hypothetical protein